MSKDIYGITFPDNATPADMELIAFRIPMGPPKGLGRYGHLRNAIDILHNDPRRAFAAKTNRPYDERKDDAFIWNDWSELMMEYFCSKYRVIAITGPNSSWKTTCAAMYAHKFWLCSPEDTIVVLTSTSIPGLKKRIWKEILRFHRAIPVGNLVASDVCIRFQKGSDEAGVFGIATGQDGDVEKAVNKIIGFHAKNVLAVCDEAHATNEALIKACRSLEAGAERFQLIVLGNAASELDPHGQMCEPKDGWNSITPESEIWETRRGICIHLDGPDCPRVKEGDEFYPGMLTKANIENAKTEMGEDSPEYWQSRRGFWAPQGVTKTILSPTMIERFHAGDKAIWASDFKKGASLDPAYEGGDRCVLRISKCGQLDTGQYGMELGPPIIIKVSATDKEPIHYQIVRQCKAICEEEGVTPDWFALDSTGEGGGLAAIFRREWSDAIMDVEFGGRASDDPISDTNPRPAHEDYANKVTELWMSFRVMLLNDQVRGLDRETAVEFCTRLYRMQGNLRLMESKTDMKKWSNRSPDLADNAVVAAALFRKKVRNFSKTLTKQRSTGWSKIVAKHNRVYGDEELVEANIFDGSYF